jgi:hypothetical protein
MCTNESKIAYSYCHIYIYTISCPQEISKMFRATLKYLCSKFILVAKY